MALAVSRQPLPAEDRVQFEACPHELRYCVITEALGHNIRRVLRGFPCHYNSSNATYLYFIRPKLHNFNKLLNKTLISHYLRKHRREFETEMNCRKGL
jgi:hypothetical protein